MNYGGYETSYTSYGAGGGAGGGGFIPGEGSQQSPRGGRQDHSSDSLRPVTIKQILDAQLEAGGDSFRIDGNVVTQLTLVGQIRNISSQHTNTTYRLDDGTGSIEVKQWIDADAAGELQQNKPKLAEGDYCRAWGKLKNFTDRRFVGAQIIRPVQDKNEISYHLLEATAVHLYFTRGPPGGAAGAGAANGATGKQQTAVSGEFGAHDLSGYDQTAKKVFQYLRQSAQSNEGIQQQEIAAKLGIDIALVARAGDVLLEGGLIYTTVDEETWAILEAE